ncbi:DUF455 domain protein [Pleurostoma richardsiae]|uniref:DUF455 domain protein n=1 Tax=Pleurostoma richardsiae TaxID=41990 RepID=A0AA38S8A3_9PEZI|nr:DUF455 domain protein [Pleurostoma richardsiae]
MQGFNMGRYVPPDAEGVTSGNALHRKHPLGSRASKLRSEGALTVRFEMPFAVWCAHCPKPTLIGQGVRFNAEKRRAGNYHSTPIWSFRMRHADCGGAIEIRTDPANTAYVVVSGGKKRDTGEDDAPGARGLLPGGAIATPREAQEARESAFASLEKTIADRAALEEARERIGELADVSVRQWDDPYARNQALRRAFRAGRRERQKDAARAEELQESMGLGIELLPPSEDDARRAALVDFGAVEDDGDGAVERVLAKPLFGEVKSGVSRTPAAKEPAKKHAPKKLKSEVAAAKWRENMVSEIVGNTRMATDPFLEPRRTASPSRTPGRLPGVKRKRATEEAQEDALEERPERQDKPSTTIQGLVDYDSD